MDLISKLVGGQGCAADGAAAARNPLARLVDGVLETAQPGGPPGPPPPPGVMAGGPRGPAIPVELQAGFREGLHGQRPLPPPPPPPPRSSLARGMAPPPGRADPWAAEFMQHARHMPPDARAAAMHNQAALEEAYMERERMMRMQANRTAGPRGLPPGMMARGPPPPHMRGMQGPPLPLGQEAHEWGEEFDRHVAGREFPMHPAELEAEWEAAEAAARHHHHHHMHAAGLMGVPRPMPPPHMAYQRAKHPTTHHGPAEEAAAAQSWAEELEAQQQGQGQGPPLDGAAELEGAWEAAGAERDAILAGHGGEALEAAWVEAGTAPTTTKAAAAAAGPVGVDASDSNKAETRAASAAVLEALRESSAGEGREGTRAKLARSEFVGFISQLSRGQVELEGNTVVPGGGQQEQAGLEGAWAESAGQEGQQQERMHDVPQGLGLDGAWEQAAQGGAQGGPVAAELDAAWANATTDAAAEATAAGASRVRDGDDVAQSAQEALDEAWAEAEAEGGNIDLESLWKAQQEGGEGKELDMDAFWDHVQAVANEYDQQQTTGGGSSKAKAGGLSKAEAAELEASWEQQARDLESWAHAHASTTATATEPGAYEFAAENEFLQAGAPSDAFAEGLALFERGELRRAALAFEAEVARRPENAEAWRMLGMTHAENDEDKRAIACLERAVEQDPYSLPALLALGVSYVNELDSVRALQNLKAWVEHNPKYQGLEIRVDEYSDGSLMDEVTQLMLQAHDWDVAASGGREDPDVQVVLGVLYNVSHDYDAAAAAFHKALAARPDDYSLWNKLGATLANSQRSEEALPAYQRALDQKPKYARGWLNMGISHANLGRYHEAASCYLQALRLNPEAGHIWGYLRVVFTAMERFDLVTLAAQQDPALFEGEFRTTLA